MEKLQIQDRRATAITFCFYALSGSEV